VRPKTMLEIARRNEYALPAETEEGVSKLYDYRDFAHFIEVWILTTNALQRYEDFRQIVAEYAQEAAEHGAVYVEGIFSPAERARRGVDWDEMFSGYCDGAAVAREEHGVEVRLTPDIFRGATPEESESVIRYSAKYRDRGIVGIGLGGLEAEYPPEAYASVFRVVRGEGFASVPHAGEVAGPARCAARSMRSAPTASATGSVRSRTRRSCRSFETARSCSTCARSRTSEPARLRRSRSIPCDSSSRPACGARSQPTTRRCSTPT
jgi:aminodeoxyfutalosine deaminase